MSEFKKGDQIAYIPKHAEGNLRHPDVELGFVVNIVKDRVWCRFYHKAGGTLSGPRTLHNSECCYPDQLIHHIHHPQDEVDRAINTIETLNGYWDWRQ